MDEHKKKMVAPIIITVIVVIYYVLYFALILAFVDILPLKIMSGIIPICFGGGMIYVCLQRIKEIKGGEEDDLGKY